jgi:hypothetical protein
MQGHPVTEVAHLLGHASPAIILAVYSHWFRDTKSDAVGGVGEGGSRGGNDGDRIGVVARW